MKFNLSITALVASVLLATNVEARWQPTPGLTWDYLLGAKDDVVKASKQQVVTFDLEQAERLVPYVHSKGQKAICYFSGGTTEHRAYDREEYQKSGLALGGNGDDWGNQWLDIRNKAKLQPLIRKRMQRARSYGCDAVEVDCLGIYHYRSDYTKEDSYVFAKWVAETAHQEGISIGLKNVAGIAESLEPYFDFAVVESCAKGNTCKNYKNFTQHQKAVFIVHYGESFTLSGSSLNTLIEAQKGMHFTCVFSQNNKLHDNVTNYDCNSGSTISGKNKKYGRIRNKR
ncbi:hypothetical protein BCR36DRAFT_405462 [Piromyces finnis]|uniref:alpha-galactosidase n=1 Tax=Piromyces finnis TaxID=1754191 RepID=A0A1Y1V415_9FUNG|nr:hypothetical protein BCR36DRAFT_405462 [Piromyces finnis]|eukprot:ORX46839.1 hypothetical protein BCR36DRAFT_405462 [Piromyces finnis]